MSYHASVKYRPSQDGLTMLTEETMWDFLEDVVVAEKRRLQRRGVSPHLSTL